MQDVHFSKVGKFTPEGVTAFLRRAFPTATAQNVECLTGISASTVDKWLRGIASPSTDHIARLAAAFGPAFLAAAMPVTAPWLEAEAVKRDLADAIQQLETVIRRAERLAV